LVFDNIIEELLESKQTLTLGQLIKITLDLKQYIVAKLAPRIRTITLSKLNSVIASMAIDPHMVVIQVQVGKNIIKDVLLDGKSGMNIMMEEQWKQLGLPNPKPTSYTL
jgi:hypothetical protein